MKYLRPFNENVEKPKVTQLEFLLALQEEFKGRFEIWMGLVNADTIITDVDNWEKYTVDPENVYININGVGDDNVTYIDYVLDDFTIPKMRNEANDSLDSDKSTWNCSDDVKDDYDELNTTILIVLDRYDDEFIISETAIDMGLWGEVCFTLGVDTDNIDYEIKQLMRRFNITKK
jgi:hypothetical protein